MTLMGFATVSRAHQSVVAARLTPQVSSKLTRLLNTSGVVLACHLQHLAQDRLAPTPIIVPPSFVLSVGHHSH